MDSKTAEWQKIVISVRDYMAQYVWPFVTPITKTEGEYRGILHGTGNYVNIQNSVCIVTAEHVIRKAQGEHLGHLPGPTNDFVAFYNCIVTEKWPIDVAVMKLGEEWKSATKSSIQDSFFDKQYSPVRHELLFWLGFPGSTAARHDAVTQDNTRYSWFGELESPGIPILTQALPEIPKNLDTFDPSKHVAVQYPSADSVSGDAIPNPKGMSGSFLWDTKYVATMAENRKWTPKLARVCGLIWSDFEKSEVVGATKIEHVYPTLQDMIKALDSE